MKLLRRYVNPQGPLPEIKRQGDLLIIGSAACVWDDLRRYDHLHGFQDRMAINDMMLYYPGHLQHGAGLHTECLLNWSWNQDWKAPREKWPEMQVHSHRPGIRVNHVWPFHRDGGTSGLFAVFAGLFMQYEHIILAGITCDESPHFYDPPWEKNDFFSLSNVQDEWKRVMAEVPFFVERVRSLSGNTAKWLGEPETKTRQAQPAPEPPIVIETRREPITISHKYSPTTVITPTGDRPEAIALLRRWMAKQTLKPKQWIIVDDGKKPLPMVHEAQVIRREPRFNDDPCTLGANLRAAIPHIKHDKILIMEDDDWYGPDYIETMAALLDDHELAGIAGTKCYHIKVPGYRAMGRGDHASLSQTGFRKSFIPQVLKAIPGSCEVDMRIWADFTKGPGHLIDGSQRQLHCAMKGLPGRAGAGVGHIQKYHTADPGLKRLQKWCHGWQMYQQPFKIKDRLVIYTAIAGNGVRDDELLDPEPIPAVDYVCFTNQPFKSKIWDIRPFTFVHPTEAVRTAKHPKVLPHIYFPEHDLSLWVDGNITPHNSAAAATDRFLKNHDMAIHRHPWRKCIYTESDVVISARKDSPEIIKATIQRYRKAKMPPCNGLYECGILFRRHLSPQIMRAMKLWWAEISLGTNSDQISWGFVMWKTKLMAKMIEYDLRQSPYFAYRPHEEIKWADFNQC